MPEECHLLGKPSCNKPAVLWISDGKKVTQYLLYKLRNDWGQAAFRLVKTPDVATMYDVLLDGQNTSCDCPGNLQWGHCKHVDNLRQLHEERKV